MSVALHTSRCECCSVLSQSHYPGAILEGWVFAYIRAGKFEGWTDLCERCQRLPWIDVINGVKLTWESRENCRGT